MKTLVIGSGGREHAICWKLRQSPKVTELYCAPGNPGIANVAKCVDIKVDDLDGLLNFAITNAIDLTVVGPEYPLTLGVVDKFRDAGLRIFGPTKEAAQLEGSKSFAKRIMVAAKVPTAGYQSVNTKEDCLKYVKEYGAPIVLKADGLASGKGVFVCQTEEEAKTAVDKLFSSGNPTVVVEEFLTGVEVSYIAATDGENIVPLAPSHDYKRIFENDEGPNTGGMGSVCPTPRLKPDEEEQVIYEVIVPTIAEMKRRGTPFSGFLYAGLMRDDDGKLNVLEFNARLGDPETQSIMRRMDSDFFEVLYSLTSPGNTPPVLQKNLSPLKWKSETCVSVVLASDGYPDSPKTGDEITGINLTATLAGVEVFHAGTSMQGGKLVTAGGRVLNVTALGNTLEKARQKVFQAVDLIQFRGRQVRRDIGK